MPQLPEGDRAALAVLGAAGALGGVVWLGAQLAALLSGRGPMALGASDVGRALVRLPATPARPSAAWPEVTGLPGPVLYWSAQLLAAILCLGIIVSGLRLCHALGGHPLGVRPDAGLGRAVDFRTLVVKRPTTGRLTLGRVGARLVAAEPGASLAVVGPTGCGKTAGLAIPALLEWTGPVLATSVKADLLAATVAERRRRGRVWVFDPTGAVGTGGATWDPLRDCRDWSGAQRTAAWLVEGARTRADGLGDADYWYGQARRSLAPYLHAAAFANRPIAQVLRWVEAEDVDEVTHLLAVLARVGTTRPGAEAALSTLGSLWGKEERLRSSVLATVEHVLDPWADPGVVVATTPDPAGLDFDEWLVGDNTLYVVAPAHEQARLRAVLATLVHAALRRALDTAASFRDGRLDRECLVLLDEAGNIAPLHDLPTVAATARAAGITVVSVWQDLAQIETLYGRAASTVLNNHRAKLFGSGITDGATLEQISRLVGEQPVREATQSIELTGGRRSVSESPRYRRVAPVDLLRRVRSGEGVLISGSCPPARVRLRPWFADRDLRQRAERSEPGGAVRGDIVAMDDTAKRPRRGLWVQRPAAPWRNGSG